MTHKPNGIPQLFQMTKNKFNDIKLVNNWIKYKLDPVFENHLLQTRPKFKYDWWRHPLPPYPQYFLIGFRRFIKMTFVRSGGTVPPSPPWRRLCQLECSLVSLAGPHWYSGSLGGGRFMPVDWLFNNADLACT